MIQSELLNSRWDGDFPFFDKNEIGHAYEISTFLSNNHSFVALMSWRNPSNEE
jgi:hypothetical protein